MLDNIILKNHIPSVEAVEKYIQKSNTLEEFVNIESALNKLFLVLCKYNNNIEDILIKCSALNYFYSTNIFKIYNVAVHFQQQFIDERLKNCDLTLVSDLARITINGKPFYFYSFASKYCSHHCPEIYPIYDSYVHKLLMYFNRRDHFDKFKSKDLREYKSYNEIVQSFRRFYGLESFNVKELDKYLWQLGKEAFSSY